jgi:hypothetical protein
MLSKKSSKALPSGLGSLSGADILMVCGFENYMIADEERAFWRGVPQNFL